MIDLARILFTVGCFSAFVIFVLITYRKGAKQSYDDVAQEIVNDDDSTCNKALDGLSDQDATHGNGANK